MRRKLYLHVGRYIYLARKKRNITKKKKKQNVVSHACDLSIRQAGAGGWLRAGGQPGPQSVSNRKGNKRREKLKI